MNIILNGRYIKVGEMGGLFPTEPGQISYGDIVEFAARNPDAIYTVSYSMPHGSDRRDGSLIKGEYVGIEDGMVFNVSNTSHA
mgnify:CR=1 FL=1